MLLFSSLSCAVVSCIIFFRVCDFCLLCSALLSCCVVVLCCASCRACLLLISQSVSKTVGESVNSLSVCIAVGIVKRVLSLCIQTDRRAVCCETASKRQHTYGCCTVATFTPCPFTNTGSDGSTVVGGSGWRTRINGAARIVGWLCCGRLRLLDRWYHSHTLSASLRAAVAAKCGSNCLSHCLSQHSTALLTCRGLCAVAASPVESCWLAG